MKESQGRWRSFVLGSSETGPGSQTMEFIA
jgi:hypothetical protein